MNPIDRFTITETEPTPFIRDFQSFLEYIKAKNPDLTPKGLISGKYLFEMNKEMTHPQEDTTTRTGQEFYPQLHLFFHLAQAGRLSQKALGKGTKVCLQVTDRVEKFTQLTAPEKYFSLLETLWIDVNWEHINASLFKGSVHIEVQTALAKLVKKSPLKPIRASAILTNPDFMGYFWLYFAFLGFWTVTQEKAFFRPGYKRYFRPGMVTPLPLGIRLASLLTRDREYIRWNLPLRRQFGEWKVRPGQPLAENSIVFLLSTIDKRLRIVQKDQSQEPFFLPFVPLFPKGELSHTLPRDWEKMVEGVYLFRVALGAQLWRKIELSSKHTLLDLHNAIQQAFYFDSDHLFSFYMDGIPWSDQKFTSPFEEEGPHVDEARIGELGLVKGQTFLYLFDYGDEWRFSVSLETIQPDKPHPKKPRIVETKGKSPEQYPDGEE